MTDRPGARDLVATCGLKQTRLARSGTWLALLVALGALSLSVIAVWPGGTDANARAMTLVLTLVALGVANWQWRAVRHENSIDRYYERLHLSNKMRLEAAEAVLNAVDSGTGEVAFSANPATGGVADDYREMLLASYMYTELDNLEYVLHKYRYGYISRRLTNQALQHFLYRCQAPGFTDQLRWIYRIKSYSELDVPVVEKLWMLAERGSDNRRRATRSTGSTG